MPSDDHAAAGAPLPPAPAPTPALPASLHMAVHDSLASVESRWREAWPRLRGTAFQSFDWVHTWYEHLGRAAGWKICIAELRADTPDGPTVLLLPLGFRREGLLRVMGFLGDAMLDYQAPLIDPDFARAVTPAHAARLWNGFVGVLPSMDLIRLRRLPASIDGLANPFAALPGARHIESAHAARLPTTVAAYAAGRDSGLLANTRRKMRRLAEAGTVRIVTRVTEPDELRRVMDALAEQKSRRWQQSGAFDAFTLPGFRAFFDRLNAGPMQGAEAVVSALMLDERPIATHWGMRMGGTLYWLLPGYDDAYARFSPGRLLMEALLRQCIEDGYAVFDFTAGDEPYKLQWADEHMKLYALQQSCSTLGNVALNIDRVRQFAKSMPALRRAVRRLRGRPDSAD